MPDKPTWAVRAPEILRRLDAIEAAEIWIRVDIEALFGLSPRAAQKLMGVVGIIPRRSRRHSAVSRADLLSFVQAKAAPELRQAATQGERDRRLRLARKLATPRLMVEAHEALPEIMARKSLDELLWLELAPGEIRIRGGSGEEILLRCLCFCKALGDSNLEEFKRRVRTSAA